MSADPVRRIPIGRTTFEWNAIIRRSHPHEAVSIYTQSMLPSGAIPNKFTFTFLLKSCLLAAGAGHRAAPHLHSHLTKLNLHSDPFLISSLLSLYSRSRQISTVLTLFHRSPSKDLVLRTALVAALADCGLPDAARHAFDEIPQPNPITWAALVSAYTKSGRHADALSAFRRMRGAGVDPTEGALVSCLASAAALSAVRDGERAHRCAVLAFARALTPALGTALLKMYARCGRIESAFKVFGEMPTRDRAAWSAMITAFAEHGKGEEALTLFDEMVSEGVEPDGITFVGVLHACSHSGMVDEARKLLEMMKRVYGIEPGAEHYGCMVDVMVRGGRVEEAWELVQSMTAVEPDEYVLKSLLRACCAHGFVEWAEWTAEKLKEIDVGNASSYVLLSNMYAEMGRWEENARVRKLMRDRGVPKVPGSSAVD